MPKICKFFAGDVVLLQIFTLECKIIFLDGFQQYKMLFCLASNNKKRCVGPNATNVNHFKVTDLSKTTPCIPMFMPHLFTI